MVRIKRIGIGSAFKIAAIFSAFMWLVTAVFFLFLPSLLLIDFSTSASTSFGGTSSADFVEFGGISMIFIFLCGVPVYAIIGGLSGALTAFVYNLVAGWVGGLELELERGVESTVAWRSVDIPNNPAGGYGSPRGGDKPKRNVDDPFS